jgi:hypothetical protein
MNKAERKQTEDEEKRKHNIRRIGPRGEDFIKTEMKSDEMIANIGIRLARVEQTILQILKKRRREQTKG